MGERSDARRCEFPHAFADHWLFSNYFSAIPFLPSIGHARYIFIGIIRKYAWVYF